MKQCLTEQCQYVVPARALNLPTKPSEVIFQKRAKLL